MIEVDGGRAVAVETRAMTVVRAVVSAAVLLSADVHLVLFADGYSDIPIVGPLFVVNVVAGLAIGVGLLVWRHWVTSFLALGFGASTLGAYLLSRTVGLFGVRELTWDAQGVLAAVAELVAVVGAVSLLVDARLRCRHS